MKDNFRNNHFLQKNTCYIGIFNRTLCFWLFSAYWWQKFVDKLEHAFKCVLWWYAQLISVLLSFYLWMQNRVHLLKPRRWGPIGWFSVSCPCLILFCLSNSCCLFSCISTCQILTVLQNLFQMLPYDLSWYQSSLSCLLQGFKKHLLSGFHA